MLLFYLHKIYVHLVRAIEVKHIYIYRQLTLKIYFFLILSITPHSFTEHLHIRMQDNRVNNNVNNSVDNS